MRGLLLVSRGVVLSVRSSSTSAASAGYCVDLIKRRDYENFLCCLLLPREARRSAFAVRAFNAEVAVVRDAVSDHNVGRMRLQFWRDAVNDIFRDGSEPPKGEKSFAAASHQQPVVKELAIAVHRHNLPKDLLLSIVDSREVFFGKKSPAFETVEEVEDYAQKSFSSVNYLLLQCVRNESKSESKADAKSGGRGLGHARHAANQLGQAQGIVTLLRAVAYDARLKRVNIPNAMLAARKIPPEFVLRQKSNEALDFVIEQLAARAQDHLENCRFRRKHLGREERLALLPAVAVDGFLDKLHKAKCNVFDASLQQRNSWLPMSLYFHKFKQTY